MISAKASVSLQCPWYANGLRQVGEAAEIEGMPPQAALVKEQYKATEVAFRHLLGVKPSGNALTAEHSLQVHMGLFGRIPDSLLGILLEFFDESSLVNLGSTCRGLFAFCSHDQLWRDITVNGETTDFQWRGNWRASRRNLKSSLPTIDCSNLFSDALYRPFLCSQVPLDSYAQDIPRANQISRLSDLSPSDFTEHWTNKPFILTEPVKKWQVFESWQQEELLNRYGSVIFRAESVDWPLKTYIQYMGATKDESPLYLFDSAFVEKMELEVGENGAYQPPVCFGEDLFTVLKHERPDFRWLIIGPERSGSTFHKDPNATSAWNAVIRGSKYWIMFPSSIMPPGVYTSEDQSEVTSPLSIAEWLLTFHAEARNIPGCIEGVCGEGEVVHVPSGWWHLVVNLESAIAITQNFVPRAHLKAAANFLKNKPDQVSGFKPDVADPYALFAERLGTEYPDLASTLGNLNAKKRKWEDVIGNDDDDGESRMNVPFTFGFGTDLEED